MKSRRPQLLIAIAALVIAPLFGSPASTQPAPKRPVDVEDVVAWKTLGTPVLSNDGQWFGYRLAPQEGDAEVVVKAVRSDKTMRFPIGEVAAGAGGGRGGPAGATSALAFSDDGTWAAFTTYPNHQAALRLKRQRRPIQSSVMVVNLASGEKKEYPKIRRFAFSGESSGWSALDSGNASYERITWSDKGDALAVLKGADDRAYRDKLYSVVGITGLAAGASAAPKKVIFDPAADATVPKGFSVSPNRDPQWTDDLEALFFGLYEPRHKDGTDDTSTDGADGGPATADAPSAGGQAAPAAEDKVDLVLWHYKDPRLQTQQEVQEARDRAYNYVAVYRVQPKKFIRLADEGLRNVTVNPRQSKWGFGSDDREYELMGSLDGRRHEDVFVIDLVTGAKKLAVRHLRYFSGASPDGSKFLYYENGDYHVYSLATGQDKNITQGLPVSFVDSEDDHNNVKTPVNAIGWASDNSSVLLTDAWDVWQVSSEGGPAVNLTVNGKKDAIRYQRRFALEPRDERDNGIDLSKPQYFSAYGEWTKKAGIARLEAGKPGAKMLTWA